MVAKDYVFVEAALSGDIYLVKKTKSGTMSQDRRVVEMGEIIGMFERILRRYCEVNNTDTFPITKEGKLIFTAKLIEK